MIDFSKYEENIFEIFMLIQTYFKEHSGITKVSVNVLLPKLKEIGVFEENGKDRTPFEELLDEMDEKDHINIFPQALGEENPKGPKWSFVFLKGFTLRELEEKINENSSEFEEMGDENYLIDLCDEILEQPGMRQHFFDLPYSDRNFPVTAYYPTLNLALFYRKIPQSKVVTHLENISWVSGCSVHREREKEKFLVNSREMLFQDGIQMLEIDHSNFNYNKSKHLIKKKTQDSLSLRRILNRTFDKPRYSRD